MSVPYQGSDFDIWVDVDPLFHITEGKPLYLTDLEGIIAICVTQGGTPNRVPLEPAKKIVLIAQNASMIDYGNLNIFLEYDTLPEFWTKTRTFEDSGGAIVAFQYYAPATDTAAEIQLFGPGIPFVWPPSISDREHRKNLYKQVLFEALMQASPDLNTQILYTDIDGVQRSATVPDMGGTLAALEKVAKQQNNQEMAEVARTLLSTSTAKEGMELISHEKLEVFFCWITTNDEAAGVWGYKYSLVVEGKRKWFVNDSLEQLGSVLEILQAVSDIYAADAKFALYHLLATGRGAERLRCLKEALEYANALGGVDARDPAIMPALQYVDQEFKRYADTWGWWLDYAWAGSGIALRAVEGKALGWIVSSLGPGIGILAYLNLEAWLMVRDTKEEFQNMSASATLSHTLELLVEEQSTSWYNHTTSQINSNPEVVIEKLCLYTSVRAALGWNFFKRVREYYYEGIYDQIVGFLRGLGIPLEPCDDPQFLVLINQSLTKNRNAIAGLRPPFYLTWKWYLTGSIPGNESDRPYSVIWAKLDQDANPISSIVSISPNPARQDRDTIIFTASADDPDILGTPPKIRIYRWISDLGKTNEELELYNGKEATFSLSASDLKAGIHNISLTVQDNEGDWSSPVAATLTVNQAELAEGHDVAIQLYVNQAGVTHSPGQSVTGEVWATNNGNYTESGDLEVRLEKASGEPLDSNTYPFSNLGTGQITPHHSFSLASNYEGVAVVRARALVQLDEDWSNNEKSVPVYFSRNLNPTDSFDGFEHIEITSGETIIVVDRRGQEHTIKFIGVADPQGNCITLVIDGEWFDRLCLGDYILGLPWAVIKCAAQYVGTYTYIFDFWWPDNIYTFSAQYLTIPWGGTATFEISRTSGSWYNVEDYTVEFLSGLLPTGWSSSVTIQDYRLVVKVQAAHGGTINFTFDGWAHLRRKSELHTIYTDAFKWMRFQTVSIAPETVITSGPEGTVFTRTVTFEWDGSDDTTPNSQLQYAYRLDPMEPEFGLFSSDVSKTYTGLIDMPYTFYVKARDLEGNEDPIPASMPFTVAANRSPNLPVNQFPVAGQYEISLNSILIASPFYDPDGNDTFAKSRFQVRAIAGTYDNPIWDSYDLTPGTNVIQVSDRLLEATEYFWRCRYQDNKEAWSEWSNETSFITKGPNDVNLCEQALTWLGYELVDQSRISRTVFEYTFRLSAANKSLLDIRDITVQLVEGPNNTIVVDDMVGFSSIEAGTEALSDDTFKIRVDRTLKGLASDIIWQICDCKTDERSSFNYNVNMDLANLAEFVECWLGLGEEIAQDLHPDGAIDFRDFAAFAEKWRKQ
jgi:hypothetical protein